MVGGEVGFRNTSIFDKAGSQNDGKSDSKESASANPLCPQCGSQRLHRDGLRYLADGSSVQRWLCRDCGYRFTEPSKTKPKWSINKPTALTVRRRICANHKEAKNLTNATETKTVAGERKTPANPHDPKTINGKILEFEFWQHKQGTDEENSKNRAYLMRRLANLGANLWNPETVKEILAKQKTWNDGYKMLIVYAYESFMKMEGTLSWIRPIYKQPEAYPFIPTQQEIIQLISSLGKKMGTFCQGLYDTGADPGELAKAQWTDINAESKTIQIRPVKRHNPRVLPVSDQFLNRLSRLPKTKLLIFNIHNLSNSYYNSQRKKAARKFANHRMMKISFTTFRHFKGTMEYHRTKDILHVKKILGHKRIENTLKYIDLEAMIFNASNDNFISKVAHNVEEACKLVEVGFEFVTGEYTDGGKIFRKRQ